MTLEFHGANEPEEQDIGLFYSLPSSCTVSDTETSSAFIPSHQTSQVYLELPSRHASTFLKSTSTSNVVKAQQIQPVQHQRTLSRSNTLPRRVQNISWHESTDTTAFDFPDGKTLKMRQWMLGFVLGESSVPFRLLHKTKLHAVDFDLDLGPVVRAVYPPMYLSPSEKENMFVTLLLEML